MKSHCFVFVCDSLYFGAVLFLIFYFFCLTSSVSGTYRKTSFFCATRIFVRTRNIALRSLARERLLRTHKKCCLARFASLADVHSTDTLLCVHMYLRRCSVPPTSLVVKTREQIQSKKKELFGAAQTEYGLR